MNIFKFPKLHDLTYSFKIERRADGFAPLWDMSFCTSADPEWTKIVDADHLSTCIGKVGYIFEQDGL